MVMPWPSGRSAACCRRGWRLRMSTVGLYGSSRDRIDDHSSREHVVVRLDSVMIVEVVVVRV